MSRCHVVRKEWTNRAPGGRGEVRALSFCPCKGRVCAFPGPPELQHVANANMSIPKRRLCCGSSRRPGPRSCCRQAALRLEENGSRVFLTETFASVNWVSEQRRKHLTSVYSATPPPAPVESLFFSPWALSSGRQEEKQSGEPLGAGGGGTWIPGHKCQEAQLLTEQSLIKIKGVWRDFNLKEQRRRHQQACTLMGPPWLNKASFLPYPLLKKYNGIT